MLICSETRHPETVARIRAQQRRAQVAGTDGWETVHTTGTPEICEACR